MSPWWSYTLTAIGILGMVVAGRKSWVGWAIGVAVQPVWIAYALVTHQPGFVISALAYGSVYGWNMVKWLRRDAATSDPTPARAHTHDDLCLVSCPEVTT